jgi:hypothetical protein
MAIIGMSAVWAGKWATATADCVGGPSELPKCSMDGNRHVPNTTGTVASVRKVGLEQYRTRPLLCWFRRICLSHSDASANFKILSFEFGTGDVLRFEYDPKQGKLTVQNQKGGRCELSVERKGEKYAVCAYLVTSATQPN